MPIVATIPNKIASFVQKFKSEEVTKIEVTKLQNYKLTKLTRYQFTKLPGYQHTRLPSYQFIILPSSNLLIQVKYRIIKLETFTKLYGLCKFRHAQKSR